MATVLALTRYSVVNLRINLMSSWQQN